MYGVFEDEEGVFHVIPVNEEKRPASLHSISYHCKCHPEVEYEDDEPIIVHNQIH